MTQQELRIWAMFHRDHRMAKPERVAQARAVIELIESGNPRDFRFAEVMMDNWFRPPGVPEREDHRG